MVTGTQKSEVVVRITATRLTVRLGWAGRVLDGPLLKRVKSSEAVWSLCSVRADVASRERQAAARRAAALRPPAAVGGAGRDSSSSSSGVGSAATIGGSSSSSSSSSSGSGKRPSQAAGETQEEDFIELLLLLPKEDAGHYWRAVFEGGAEKSHIEVWQHLRQPQHLQQQLLVIRPFNSSLSTYPTHFSVCCSSAPHNPHSESGACFCLPDTSGGCGE